MIVSPLELLAFVSGIMTLEPGDVIMTGTPPGVGPLGCRPDGDDRRRGRRRAQQSGRLDAISGGFLEHGRHPAAAGRRPVTAALTGTVVDARIHGVHGPRFRSSPRAQRVLAARRRLPCEGARPAGEGAGHAGGGAHRPRHAGRRRAVLPRRPGRGHQTHHRPGALRGRRPARSRRRQGALRPPHAAGQGRVRLQEPGQALHARLPGGLLLQAARRLGAAQRASRGPHRAERLHERPHLAAAARGQRRGRSGRAAAPQGAVRPGRPVRGAAGRRPPRAARAAAAARAARRPGRPAHRRHQRRALPAPRGRLRPRRAALHPDAEQPRRRGPHALRQRRVLPQVGGRDARALQGLPRRLRRHPGHRRAL